MPTHGGGTDPEDHYQPWLRNQPPAKAGSPAGADAVRRPQPLPLTQADTAKAAPPPPQPARPATDMSADELLARPIALPDPDTLPSDRLVVRIGKVAEAVSSWTGERLERADIPARIARLQPGDRAEKVARGGKAAVQAAMRATARGAEQLGAAALPRLQVMADRTRTGIAGGASAASRILSDGGRRIAGSLSQLPDATHRALAVRQGAPLPSQLDRLIEQDAQDAPPDRASEQSLPLFSQPGPGPAAIPLADTAQQQPPAAGPASPAAAAAAATPTPAAAISATPGERAGGGTGGGGTGGGGAGGGGAGGQSGGISAGGMMPTTSGWLRHPASWVAGGVALVLSGFVGGMMWDGGSNRAVTERIVHDYLLNNPEIIPQAMERLQAQRVAEAIDGQRNEIERPFSGAWAGAPDGDVTLTVFTDYACTYCRASVADIDRLLREDRRLKVVFRELPILSQESENAARFALSAARSGRYMAVHRALFAAGNPDASARQAVATQFSVNASASALADPAITRELRSNMQLARGLGFDGTPSWVVGNQALTGAVGYQRLREAIAEARSR